MEAAWRALAEEQNWLDGKSSADPVGGRAEGEGEMNRYRKRSWTPEEESRLRTLVEEGASPLLVAAQLKRTVTATRGRASVIGVSFRPTKPELKAKGK